MEDSDIIKYLALTIARKEKVIVDLIRQLEDERLKADQYAEYWREDADELKRLKGEGKQPTGKYSCE